MDAPPDGFGATLMRAFRDSAGLLLNPLPFQCLHNKGAFGRTATVKLKFKEFRIITLSHSDTGSITNKALLLQTSLDLVRSIFPPEMGIRLVGVTVSNFGTPPPEDGPSLPLFPVEQHNLATATQVPA